MLRPSKFAHYPLLLITWNGWPRKGGLLAAWLMVIGTVFPVTPAFTATETRQKLSDLAWASRGDHRPISPEQIDLLRKKLQTRARQLEESLASQGDLFARQWKHYLQWELLESQFSSNSTELTAKGVRQSLLDLEQIVKQFRSNYPGLERPEFTQTAKAIDELRIALPWAMAAQTHDPHKEYQRLLSQLKTQLERHQTEATTETNWKIGRLLGLLDQLGDSEPLVEAMHDSLVQPNLYCEISASFVQRAGQQPIQNRQPVRDLILGTTIRGTAETVGTSKMRLLPSNQAIQLEVQIFGDIHSTTRGHQHPVRIFSTADTHFSAVNQITLSKNAFQSGRTTAQASTDSHIHSIQKKGGPLGSQLIEKVAWKRACQNKKCAEQIAARHAETKITNNFETQLTEGLLKAREKFEQKILAPLTRRNLQPRHLQFVSQADQLCIEGAFATPHQLAAAGGLPEQVLPSDLSVRVHQSSVTNIIAPALAGITIQQDQEDRPPQLIGKLPDWLPKDIMERRLKNQLSPPQTPSPTKAPILPKDTTPLKKRAQPETPGLPRSSDPLQNTDQQGPQKKTPPYSFQPWSITLNPEQPLSVWLDKGQAVLRIRASRLSSEKREYKNWDFIVRYDISPQENSILLQRSGKIEVFPTGFDPRWDKKMSSAKSGFRNTLAKNMNLRAEHGESFPAEILIPPIQLPESLHIPGEMTLEQIRCDNQWLTLGWVLP